MAISLKPCTKCGMPLPANALKCGNCGMSLEISRKSVSKKPRKKEIRLFEDNELFLSFDMQDWKKIALIGTNLNLHLKLNGKWKKIPNEDISIVDKHNFSTGLSVLELRYKEKEWFLSGRKIDARYSQLLSILSTKATNVEADIYFTPEKRKILKALFEGRRHKGDIQFKTQLDYEIIEEVMKEFVDEGVVNSGGFLTKKGALIALEEVYR